MKTLISTLIFFALSMILGCASTSPPLQQNISSVPVAQNVNLDLTHISLQEMQGSYLQRIKTTIKNKQGGTQEHIVSVYLTVGAKKIDAIAFNDVAGRLYQLTWTANELVWTRSKYVPVTLKPENIIADFLLTHLPLSQLNAALSGATAEEKVEQQTKVRVIKKNDEILRVIKYSQPLKNIWQEVVLINPQWGYTLDIQTVKQ